MATLEDKILGNKMQYYCSSSSEDEDGNDSGCSDKEEEVPKTETSNKDQSIEISDWDGSSSNTGPKGVIRVC